MFSCKRAFSCIVVNYLLLCLFSSTPNLTIAQKLPCLQATTEKFKVKTKVFKAYALRGGEKLLQKQQQIEYNIYGQSIQHINYQIDPQGNIAFQSEELIKFNRRGQRIGSMRYNHNKALVWSEDLKFDEDDQLIEQTQTIFDSDIPRSYTTAFDYNQNNKLTSSITLNRTKEIIAEQKRSYNTNGELLGIHAWCYHDPEQKIGKQIYKTNYEYDRRGNLTRASSDLQKDNTKWKDVRRFENNYVVEWWQYKNGEAYSYFKHDKKGSLPVIHDYEIPPPIPYYTPFEYDDSKRDPLQYIKHEPGQAISIKTNTKGLRIKEVLREKEQIITVTYFFYNENDQLIRKKTVHKLDKTVEETLFKYDSYNNILEKSSSLNGIPFFVESFDYKYYH